MADDIKSGKQVIDEFISELPDVADIDKEIANAILKLQEEDKLTPANLSNELLRLREAKINDQN